mmetsp:Transcript_43414/g.51082  ORF Transcript_43414/g.51082 Transcript_43414/m.51082 type:complete len:85 (+) Transcript_43414:1-255(+)
MKNNESEHKNEESKQPPTPLSPSLSIPCQIQNFELLLYDADVRQKLEELADILKGKPEMANNSFTLEVRLESNNAFSIVKRHFG